MNQELLEKLYVKEGKSIQRIATELDVGKNTVWKRLRKLGIPRRPCQITVDSLYIKDDLHRLYWLEGRSISQIAKTYGKSPGALQNAFETLEIPTRTREQGAYLYHGKSWPNFQRWTACEWELLAWMIDLEGNIGFKNYDTALPAIQICTTDPRISYELKRLLPEFCVTSIRSIAKSKSETNKFGWQICSIPVVGEICRNTIPYANSKKAIARLMYEFCLSRLQSSQHVISELERRYMEAVRELNRKNRPYPEKLQLEEHFLREFHIPYSRQEIDSWEVFRIELSMPVISLLSSAGQRYSQ
jgi:transposase-like protein